MSDIDVELLIIKQVWDIVGDLDSGSRSSVINFIQNRHYNEQSKKDREMWGGLSPIGGVEVEQR